MLDINISSTFYFHKISPFPRRIPQVTKLDAFKEKSLTLRLVNINQVAFRGATGLRTLETKIQFVTHVNIIFTQL